MSVWLEVYDFRGIGGYSKEGRLTEVEVRNNAPLFSGSVSTTSSWTQAYINDGSARRQVLCLLKKPSADHLFIVSKTTPASDAYGVLLPSDERSRRFVMEYGARLFVRTL